MAFCARDPRVIVTVLYSKITYFKCLSQLSNNNSWFKCPSFRSYNVSFGTMEVLNRHVCPLRLGETSYAPVIPRRCLALPHSALWNSKKDELENKSVQYDPETKSLVQEMTQHFLEDFNAPFTESVDNSESNKKTTSVSKPVSHLQNKFLLFEDKDAHVVVDIHEELHHETANPFSPVQERYKEFSCERGTEGVYDIHQLVEVLELENAQNICVIRVPPELLYAQYLVVVSGRSLRHVTAIAEYVKKLYKKKKYEKEAFVIVQGKGSKDWLAVDMGNIVLHIFMPEARARYDIETLWAVGEKHDDLCQNTSISSNLQSYLQLFNEMKPLNSGGS